MYLRKGRVLLYWTIALWLLGGTTTLHGQSSDRSIEQNAKKIDEVAYLKAADSAVVNKRYRKATWFINEVAMKRWESNDYDSAVLLFNQSLEYNEKINNQQGIFGINSNLAMIHADMGQYEKALGYFQTTLEGRRARGEKVGTVAALINISVVLNNLKRHNEAAVQLEEALELAREMNDPEQMRSCYGMLSETYEKAGRVEESLKYFELYRTFHELVQREKEQSYKEDVEEAELRARLLASEKEKKELALELKNKELEQKEQELEEASDVLEQFSQENQELLASASKSELLKELLETQNQQITNELEAERLRLQQKSYINRGLWIGAGFLLIIASLIYWNGRQRKKKNEELKRAVVAEQQSREEAQVALEQLQEAQTQLIHQEKMASLGQLTAGIAHEINNPLNFIYSGIFVIQSEKEIYDNILHEYQKLHQVPAEQRDAALSRVRALEEELEVDDVKKELDGILGSIQEGAIRVKDIVQSLQYFSRQRHMVTSQADMHQCLDSTLMLLSNLTQEGVEIQKEYAPSLPEINCFPSQINQVLMNILVNAIQATEGQEKRKVLIKTLEEEENVMISIQDNGHGIKPEHLSSIFNPFFTTKDVGKGMGLGLSISYGIVQDHGGELQAFNSDEGGAKFVLTLPKEAQKVEQVVE